MKNKKIFLRNQDKKFHNYLNQENNFHKKKPIKIVNLFIDNVKNQKLLNEDDKKIFFYTNKLINQFSIDISEIKRAKSSYKRRKRIIDHSLFNCYKFFDKTNNSKTKNLISIDDQSNNYIYSTTGFLSDRSNKENILNSITNDKNIKKKFINKYNMFSQKEVFNSAKKNPYILNNIKNEMYYLPNFKTFTNLLDNKSNNYTSTYQNYLNNLNSLNNLDLNHKDYSNSTKVSYLKIISEKTYNNLNYQNKNNINTINNLTDGNRVNKYNKEKVFKVNSLKEKFKSFGFANKKKQEILYDKPPPNYYETDKYFYYNIYPENCGWLIKNCFKHRTKWKECHSLNTNLFNFKWKEIANINDFLDYNNNVDIKQMINHYEFNSCITNKYKLFLNFIKYCENKNIEIFKYIPFTIIFDDSEFLEISDYRANFKKLFLNINNYIFEIDLIKNQTFDRRKINYRTYFPLKDNNKLGTKTYIQIPSTHYVGKNLWIVKAPNLNRGRCIKVFNDYEKIIKFIKEIAKGNAHEYDNINEEKENKIDDIGYKYKSDKIIIQKYIEKPFLYNGRKFDIRIWVLLTHKMCAYMFKEGHLKVSSINYDLDSNNSFIHLTNYSLQKYNKHFSEYEKGNEVSFETFQKYINDKLKKDIKFKEIVYPQFTEIIKHTIKSSKNLINIKHRKNCFELMGYDFLLDEDFNVFLLEINSNPGLEISSEIIKMLVPRMIDDALRLTADEIFITDYDKEWKNQNGEYCSKFHVKGYKDEDNLWEFICDANDNNFDENNNCIINDYKDKFKKYKIKKHHNIKNKNKAK